MSMQPTFRPVVESLEQRDLPTAGLQAFVNAGNLYVLGTNGNDSIQVTETNNRLSVTGAAITANNAHVSSVDANTISNVIVYGNGGNDLIDLSTVKNNASIYGGAGDDTIRCGLGNDTVNADTGYDRVYRPYVASQPVVNGLAVTDIKQGQNSLCQTDAALAEAVSQGVNFAADIQYAGANLYNVKLPGNVVQKVYYNGWTTPNDPVETNGEFWTVLLQRARLQSLGIDTTVQHTNAQWNQLNTQTKGQLYSINDALAYFAGNAANLQAINSVKAQTLQASLAKGDSILAQSQSSTYVSANGIIGNHVYAVLAVYNDAGTWKVRLYNPWGMDRENGATIDSLDKSHPAANDGIITLTWAQFTSTTNFKAIVVSARK